MVRETKRDRGEKGENESEKMDGVGHEVREREEGEERERDWLKKREGRRRWGSVKNSRECKGNESPYEPTPKIKHYILTKHDINIISSFMLNNLLFGL